MTPCPDRAALEEFLAGGLDAEANQVIDTHLESCHACQQKLEEAVRLPDAWRALLAQTGDYREAAEATTAVNAARGEPASRSEPPALPGYAVEEELGRGGMGVVYRARDVRLRRDVAIKVLGENLAEAPQAVQRFVEEAHIAAQLQHPGIAAVHELGVLADGRPFLAMKLVKGQTLAERLRQRSISQEELPSLLSIFGQVCQAVAYAHSKGVIHRDLKPGNIMVGAFGEVQVMDWGLARVLHVDEGVSGGPEEVNAGTVIDTPRDDRSTWRTQGVVGTYAYMAPEQARGQSQRVDRRSDVFALGAILCEILSGKPPYSGGSGASIRQQAEDADLAEALARLQGCGADAPLVELTRTCLACKQEERPAEAAEVAQAVAAYQAQVQERLRRAELERAEAEVREAEGRKRRRLHAGLAAAALLAVLLATGGGWLWHRRQAERRHDVETALAAAAEHRDGARWAQARRSLDHAEDRLGPDGAADLVAALEQARADLELAEQLDDIRLRKATLVEGKFLNIQAANREYQQAFHAAGMGFLEEDIESVAARVRASTIRGQLLAALDDWAAGTVDDKQLTWLLGVARLADDPRFARFRDPKAWQRPPTLRHLAEQAVAEDVPPSLLAALTGRLGDIPAHLPLLRAAVARRPNDFWAHFYLANAVAQESPREAAGFYWAALALRPHTGAVHNNLGVDLHSLGDWQGASAAFRQAIACNARDAMAHTNLGATLHASGDVKGAIAAYRQAIACDPKLANPHTNLGIALEAIGDVKGAIAAHRQAIACNPRLARAHNNLGVALYTMEDYKGAIAAHRQAIACDPRLTSAYNNLGNALRDSGDVKGAIAAHRQAIACAPKEALGHYHLGVALKASGDIPGAIAAYRQAIACNPKDARAHTNLGAALYTQGDGKGAIAAYRQAILCDPTDAKAHYNLGIALHTSGDLKGAVPAYRQAAARNPTNPDIHNNLGAALRDSGDLKAALAAFRQAIACAPRHAGAHANLGNALKDSGDLKGAIAAYRQAIACDPKHIQAQGALGLVLQLDGQFAEAVLAVRRLLELLPNNHPTRPFMSRQLQQCEVLQVLEQRLPAILAGKRKPANTVEMLALADLCARYKQRPAVAARFYTDAFLLRPALVDDRRNNHRYNAACAAVRAAAGEDRHGPLTDAERCHWRQQARAWLEADLAAWTEAVTQGAAPVHQVATTTLRHWQTDADLVSVRDPAMLSWLPLEEAVAWCRLWTDVARLLRRVQEGT